MSAAEVIVGAIAVLVLYETGWRPIVMRVWRGMRKTRPGVSATSLMAAMEGQRPDPAAVERRRRVGAIVTELGRLQAAGEIQVSVGLVNPRIALPTAELGVVVSLARQLVRDGHFTPDQIEDAVALAIDSAADAGGAR